MTTPAKTSDIIRQPEWVTRAAIVCKKTSCPAAAAAVKRPTTRPSRERNQRPAIYAAKYPPIKPLERPTTTPHSRISSQDLLIAGVSRTLTAVVASARVIVRRAPKRSITTAANGPTAPKSRRLIPRAKEIVARDQ